MSEAEKSISDADILSRKMLEFIKSAQNRPICKQIKISENKIGE